MKKTVVITIPVNRIRDIEKLLGYQLALNQIPVVKIRVPVDKVAAIRKKLKADK